MQDLTPVSYKGEYGVDAIVEPVGVQSARRVVCKDEKEPVRREQSPDIDEIALQSGCPDFLQLVLVASG